MMRRIGAAFSLILISFNVSALAQNESNKQSLNDIVSRCGIQSETEPKIYSDRYTWGLTPEDMTRLFTETYESGERLIGRAYYDASENSVTLPLYRSTGVKPVRVTLEFIQTLTQRVEETLKRGYADYVFFPDMGHSHLYFEQDHWDSVYKPFLDELPKNQLNELYEKMLGDSKLFALFHTAEQLAMVDEEKNVLNNPYIRFRWWHRNPTLPINLDRDLRVPTNPDHNFNTVRKIHGFDGWSSGFYINSSKDGCFSYKNAKGETLFYDISLKPIEPDPATKGTENWLLQKNRILHFNSHSDIDGLKSYLQKLLR